MAFAESVAAIGRTEGHDGTSASRTSVVVFEFPLEGHVPAEHLLRSTDSFIELGELRRGLAAFYSAIGQPSVDPELMIRMLIVGYCLGIRSERRLCDEVHLNLAS
jgi:transposase